MSHLHLWPRKDQKQRDLCDHVCRVIHGVEEVELVAIEIQLFFHATNICICDVGLIQEFGEDYKIVRIDGEW